MQLNSTVIFKHYFGKWESSLYLREVKRNEDGTIESGWVVNGAWWYKRTDTEELAITGYTFRTINNKNCNKGDVVNRWPIEPYLEIPVWDIWIEDKSDYQAVMDRAQAIMDNDQTFEFKFKTQEQLLKEQWRREELDAELDDDIPF